MQSCLYAGWVRHRRNAPVPHAFRYRLSLLYLDLAELPQALDGRWLWSARRPALARWHRADHGIDPARDLAEEIRELVATRSGRRPAGPIRLLTAPRFLGYGFNPVSFYYCFDSGEQLQAVVAEVTNTPWGERHAYVLDGGGRVVRGEHDKAMRVSPFMGMDQRYAVAVGEPGPTLSVHIESVQEGDRAFDATLKLRRRPFSPTLSSLRVLPLIYGHAVVLRAKGVRRA